MPNIEFKIDDEPYTTVEKTLTPRDLLGSTFANKDETLFYLVQRTGNATHSYKDKLLDEIHMHPRMTFFTNALGPTPVSCK